MVNDGGVAGVLCGGHYSISALDMKEFIQPYNYTKVYKNVICAHFKKVMLDINNSLSR